MNPMTEVEYFMVRTCWTHAWVRYTLDTHKWSYTELARRTGVRRQTIMGWVLNGTRPQWRTFRKLFAVAARPYIEHEVCRHCQPGSFEHRRSRAIHNPSLRPDEVPYPLG